MIRTGYGVIVGRFQVHELHQGHIDLIQTVLSQHARVLLFLGVSKVLNSYKHPLDFLTRKAMIEARFGGSSYAGLSILPLEDMAEDAAWVAELDHKIRIFAPMANVTLYGGRESFAPIYEQHQGKFGKVITLANIGSFSGTESRESAAGNVIASPEFRAGVIYASRNRYPAGIPYADVALFDPNRERVLLCRRKIETGCRFPGGRFDPQKDASLQATATRKLWEKTRYTSTSKLICLDTPAIKDWRYAGDVNSIVTAFFLGTNFTGTGMPGDDVDGLEWIDFDRLPQVKMVPEHRSLRDFLVRYLRRQIGRSTAISELPLV